MLYFRRNIGGIGYYQTTECILHKYFLQTGVVDMGFFLLGIDNLQLQHTLSLSEIDRWRRSRCVVKMIRPGEYVFTGLADGVGKLDMY